MFGEQWFAEGNNCPPPATSQTPLWRFSNTIIRAHETIKMKKSDSFCGNEQANKQRRKSIILSDTIQIDQIHNLSVPQNQHS